MSRSLFTDGLNSMWHVVFGIGGVYFWPIVVVFILYQLKDPYEENILIDILEFMIGYMITVVIVGDKVDITSKIIL
jgi:hypothetical protein